MEYLLDKNLPFMSCLEIKNYNHSGFVKSIYIYITYVNKRQFDKNCQVLNQCFFNAIFGQFGIKVIIMFVIERIESLIC